MMPLDRRDFVTGAISAGLSVSAMAAPPTPPLRDGDGVRWITLSNGYKVWTQRVGRGPKKVLLLNGGPGLSHLYLQIFARHLPAAGYEMYFYDQLGTGRSDRPTDTGLWTLDRYIEEVEQVREQLDLDRFVLLGHSWGGILGIEYSLRHQDRLAGFVLSDMTASFADYGRYTRILRNRLPSPVRRRLDALEKTGGVRSDAFNALVVKELYPLYICRLRPWPKILDRAFAEVNPDIYVQMQGANEFDISGSLKDWDRWSRLSEIHVPTLVTGARFDEMDPASVRREAHLIPNSHLYISETGSHLNMWDDESHYFRTLLHFLETNVKWAG